MGEPDLVWGAGHPVRDDVMLRHRLVGDRVPLLPLAWALGRVVGVEQELSADRTATVLLLQETQVGSPDRQRWTFATPLGPVIDQDRMFGLEYVGFEFVVACV
jgi:hypothetical protein